MNFYRNFLLICTLIMTSAASAGVLLEPYFGYSKGSGESGYAGINLDQSYSAPILGGRIGGTLTGFMAGVDYSTQAFKLEAKAGAFEFKDKVEKNQLGIFVGYKLPVMFRFWGTYFFRSKIKGKDAPKESGQAVDSNTQFKDGTGFGLGVGYSLLPFVSANLEYRNLKYDKFSYSGIEMPASVYSKKLSLTDIILSVSLPFTLF